MVEVFSINIAQLVAFRGLSKALETPEAEEPIWALNITVSTIASVLIVSKTVSISVFFANIASNVVSITSCFASVAPPDDPLVTLISPLALIVGII